MYSELLEGGVYGLSAPSVPIVGAQYASVKISEYIKSMLARTFLCVRGWGGERRASFTVFREVEITRHMTAGVLESVCPSRALRDAIRSHGCTLESPGKLGPLRMQSPNESDSQKVGPR